MAHTKRLSCHFQPYRGAFLFEAQMDTELKELIKSIRNRCDACLLLDDAVIPEEELKRILPTILEDIGMDAQAMMFNYCTEQDDD